MKLSRTHALFRNGLLRWYSHHGRSLPWRHWRDPYRIWLREVVLQQTRVEQGIPYLKRLLRHYPTLKRLAHAHVDELLHLWQGLGYYSRARHLHQAARHLYQNYGGRFPRSYEEWLALKGVGPCTAAAIVSFAFNQPFAVVDGNVCRVLARAFGLDQSLTHHRKAFETLAQTLLDPQQPGTFNQALMDFGATVCTPRQPQCSSCFFRKHCVAFQQGLISDLPRQSPKVAVRTRYLVFFIFHLKGSTYITRRDAKDIYRHLFAFPWLETDGSYDFPKVRRLLQSSGWLKKVPRRLWLSSSFQHRLSHQCLQVTFAHVPVHSSLLKVPEGWQRVPYGHLKNFAFPQFIRQYLKNYVPCEKLLAYERYE
ncbi:MAG: A/G-specific adenine glycosylase [Chitinophagales bacterium]|nr:A/G-specific adenine glycosylase [Chitinophagales bacterium]MDW8428811.1 A/G-specific adenine glycosylase [Chitinophagales bacterium]